MKWGALLALAGLASGCAGPRIDVRSRLDGLPAVSDGAQLAREASTMSAMGQDALAVERYRQWLRIEPDSKAALQGLAAAYERLGRPDLARRYYELALALDPQSPDLLAAADRATKSAAEPEHVPQYPVRGTTISLPLLEPEPRPVPRLERLSQGAVLLVTRSAPSATASTAATARSPAAALVSQAPVRILNAAGRAGQASRLRGFLAERGWTGSIANSPFRQRVSIIMAGPEGGPSADRLSRVLPFRTTRRVGGVRAGLVLVLGQNALGFDDGLRSRSRS